jgi:class 3 adenylate cyclase
MGTLEQFSLTKEYDPLAPDQARAKAKAKAWGFVVQTTTRNFDSERNQALVERRLAAILAADVAGFSRMIGDDEVGVLKRLRALRSEIIEPLVVQRGGRIFKLMGDGLLAEFPSAVWALHAAIEIQLLQGKRNADLPKDRRLELRMAVHQGDVVVEERDLLGAAVNIAARLESLAEPGGICISARVCEDVAGNIALDGEDLGEQELKNIARPVRVYRLNMELVTSLPQATKRQAAGRPLRVVTITEQGFGASQDDAAQQPERIET